MPLEPDVPLRAQFEAQFEALFGANFGDLFRTLDRLSGDAELASDLAQETFVRLLRRGSLPDEPRAWLITVALNLLRNARSAQARRRHLLTGERAVRVHGDPFPAPLDGLAAGEERTRVSDALARLPERDRALLLLRAEDYSYREMATALDLNEASVGTLLARARAAFRAAYGEWSDAPRR